MPGDPPFAKAPSRTRSTSSPIGGSGSPKSTLKKITSPPRGLRTRTISPTVSSLAYQWKASAVKTASTEPSGTGIASARPASASAPGTNSSSTARIASSGSTAITRPNRGTRSRVSLPVPAPRSSTVESGPSSRSAAARSISSAGHTGRPSSYSRADCPNLSGGASFLANSGKRRGALLTDHLARDHEALDLIGALVDLRDLRVAHHPLDGVLLHVAVAAEDLDGVGRHVHRDVGAVELRHRRDLRELRRVDAVVDHLAALVEKPASGLALRLHVGKRGRDQLMLRDRLAHRLTRLRILERVVRRTLGQSQPLSADARPRAVEDPHRDPEPLALLAEQVVRRHAAVVEEQLAGRRALDPHLRLDPADLEARRLRLDHEGRDARVTGRGVGLGEDDVDPGNAGVGDEPLGAVDHVLTAFEPRLGAHRGRVRSRPGLAQRIGRQPLAARELRQEALLLLLRAGELDPERAQLLHGEDQAASGADFRDLLDRDERHQRARACAAVHLVEHDPEDLVLAEELDDVPRELGALVDLGRPRRDPLAREVADQIADLALLVGQRLVGHAAMVLTGLNQSPFSADNAAAVILRLPLLFVPLPAIVLGALVAAGML